MSTLSVNEPLPLLRAYAMTSESGTKPAGTSCNKQTNKQTNKRTNNTNNTNNTTEDRQQTARGQTDTHADKLTDRQSEKQRSKETHRRTHKQPNTRTHTHARARAHAHAHARTRTRTYTHTPHSTTGTHGRERTTGATDADAGATLIGCAMHGVAAVRSVALSLLVHVARFTSFACCMLSAALLSLRNSCGCVGLLRANRKLTLKP